MNPQPLIMNNPLTHGNVTYPGQIHEVRVGGVTLLGEGFSQLEFRGCCLGSGASGGAVSFYGVAR